VVTHETLLSQKVPPRQCNLCKQQQQQNCEEEQSKAIRIEEM